MKGLHQEAIVLNKCKTPLCNIIIYRLSAGLTRVWYACFCVCLDVCLCLFCFEYVRAALLVRDLLLGYLGGPPREIYFWTFICLVLFKYLMCSFFTPCPTLSPNFDSSWHEIFALWIVLFFENLKDDYIRYYCTKF